MHHFQNISLSFSLADALSEHRICIMYPFFLTESSYLSPTRIPSMSDNSFLLLLYPFLRLFFKLDWLHRCNFLCLPIVFIHLQSQYFFPGFLANNTVLGQTMLPLEFNHCIVCTGAEIAIVATSHADLIHVA